ncbi:hypothetical protein X739_31100 [Mesorhizobium sp. LNHC220B00]|nr:hypothetical protein X739_31100 [Mesorhizobium sp. LNHC220B00]
MRDNMDRIEAFVPCERGSDLLRRRPAAFEHDSPNFWSQIAENRREVGN